MELLRSDTIDLMMPLDGSTLTKFMLRTGFPKLLEKDDCCFDSCKLELPEEAVE